MRTKRSAAHETKNQEPERNVKGMARERQDVNLMEALAEYYTTEQAAKELGVWRASIRKAIGQGRLNAVKFGHGWLIRKDELENYKNNRQTPGPSGQKTH